MKNFVERGETILLVAIASAINSGDLVAVGDTVGVSAATYAVGQDAVLSTCGVFNLPKASAGALAQGAKVYLAAGLITTTSTGNVFVGYVWKAAVDGEITVNVLLER